MELAGLNKIIQGWLNHQGRVPEGPNTGQPLYKLTWSDDAREWRRGIFNDFTSSGLFLRQFTGEREVPKYPYIKGKWVLEKWGPPSVAMTSELPESKGGSWEPFFVFEDKKQNYLTPTLKVVQFIVESARKQVRVSHENRRLEIAAETKLREDQEVQDFMDQIDTSEIGNALRLGEAIGYSGKEFKGN